MIPLHTLILEDSMRTIWYLFLFFTFGILTACSTSAKIDTPPEVTSENLHAPKVAVPYAASMGVVDFVTGPTDGLDIGDGRLLIIKMHEPSIIRFADGHEENVKFGSCASEVYTSGNKDIYLIFDSDTSFYAKIECLLQKNAFYFLEKNDEIAYFQSCDDGTYWRIQKGYNHRSEALYFSYTTDQINHIALTSFDGDPHALDFFSLII